MARLLRLALVVSSAVVVLLSVGGHHPLPVDRHLMRTVVDHRTAALVSAARIGSHLGDPPIVFALAVVSVALLAWRRSWSQALLPAFAVMIGASIEVIMKQVFGRARPPAAYRLLNETDPSFPSGHATGSAALFVAVALVVGLGRSRRVQFATVALAGGVAALICVSRVILGVHWPTDVVAGWFLGVAAAAATLLVGRGRAGRHHRGGVGFPGAGSEPSSHDRLPTSLAP